MVFMEHACAEGSLPRHGITGYVGSSGVQGQGKHSRKRTESNSHSDFGAIPKRQATADGAASSMDYAPSQFGVDASVPSSTQIPHMTPGSSHYSTRSRSKQPAQPACTNVEHSVPVQKLSNVRPGSDVSAQRRNGSNARAMPEIHTNPARDVWDDPGLASDHSPGIQEDATAGSPLPISQAACFDDSLWTALTKRQADRADEAMQLTKSGRNPLFDREDLNESLDEDPFLPDSWDADTLAEWFVCLISWQNQKHSIQGLLGGLYVLAFTQELWQRVTWAPVSVIAFLALFAVGHSAMPAGMPALSKMLRKAGVTDQVRFSGQRCMHWDVSSTLTYMCLCFSLLLGDVNQASRLMIT
jgi:hypothetical protein